MRKTLHTSQEDDGADDDQDDTHDPGGDAESRLHGGADGVGLDHTAHESKGQDDGDSEEARQELSEASLERRGDVTDLDKAGLDRVPQAHTHQQEDEDIVAEVLVDLGYDGEQYTF